MPDCKFQNQLLKVGNNDLVMPKINEPLGTYMYICQKINSLLLNRPVLHRKHVAPAKAKQDRWTDRRQTKWSLCSALLCWHHKNELKHKVDKLSFNVHSMEFLCVPTQNVHVYVHISRVSLLSQEEAEAMFKNNYYDGKYQHQI